MGAQEGKRIEVCAFKRVTPPRAKTQTCDRHVFWPSNNQLSPQERPGNKERGKFGVHFELEETKGSAVAPGMGYS